MVKGPKRTFISYLLYFTMLQYSLILKVNKFFTQMYISRIYTAYAQLFSAWLGSISLDFFSVHRAGMKWPNYF